jgi:hypothetical protein
MSMMNFNVTTKFVEYLSSRGIEYSIIDSVFVSFKYKSWNYLYQYNSSDDVNYFRIMLPNVNNHQIDEQLKKLMDELNNKYKIVKVLELGEGKVWLTAEALIYSSDGIELLFKRLIDLLDNIITIYRNREVSL